MAEEETPTPEEETVVEDASDGTVAEPEAAAPAEAPAEPEPEASTPAEAPAAEPPAPPATPKERRQRARAAKAAATPTRKQLNPQERQAERQAERRRKAGARRARRLRERQQSQQRDTPTPDALPSLRPQRTGQQKVRQGIVVSDRAAKTITVRIDVTRRHPRYEKVVRTSTTLHAHDERGEAHIGDTVTIRESRPLSRTKRWRLVEVLERAK